jgi:hypothetical protein
MIKVKLISKKDQGIYKEGQPIRTVFVERNFNISSITIYYDFEVIAILIS